MTADKTEMEGQCLIVPGQIGIRLVQGYCSRSEESLGMRLVQSYCLEYVEWCYSGVFSLAVDAVSNSTIVETESYRMQQVSHRVVIVQEEHVKL